MTVLRDYQHRCVDETLTALESHRSALLVLPTGAGKTVVFTHIVEKFLEAGRVLILAHREELIRQIAQSVERWLGISPAIEKAQERAHDNELWGRDRRIVVASVQSLCNPNRLARFDPSTFSLVVTDEAHHGTAESYRRIYNHFHSNPRCKFLGVTATPDRADEEALGQIYKTVAFEYSLPDCIDDGWLVPIRQKFVEVESLDFSNLKTVSTANGSDFAPGELEELMNRERPLHEVIVPTLADACGIPRERLEQLSREGRMSELPGEVTRRWPTIIFCVGCGHAERVADIINRYLPNSASVLLGYTDALTRTEIVARYKRGDTQFLVAVGVPTEGFDAPNTVLVSVARPTKSRALYTQMVGRATRILPGVIESYDAKGLAWRLETAEERHAAIARCAKAFCGVLDFVGVSGRHKLISTADILGDAYPDYIVELATAEARQRQATGAKSVNIREVLQEVEHAEQEKRRRFLMEQAARQTDQARLRPLVASAKWGERDINPFDVFDMTPRREPGYAVKAATEKQLALLRRAKVDIPPNGLTVGEAGRLITEVKRRWANHLCTFPQAKLLARFGEPTDCSFDEAKRIIDEIARNGWRPRKAV